MIWEFSFRKQICSFKNFWEETLIWRDSVTADQLKFKTLDTKLKILRTKIKEVMMKIKPLLSISKVLRNKEKELRMNAMIYRIFWMSIWQNLKTSKKMSGILNQETQDLKKPFIKPKRITISWCKSLKIKMKMWKEENKNWKELTTILLILELVIKILNNKQLNLKINLIKIL